MRVAVLVDTSVDLHLDFLIEGPFQRPHISSLRALGHAQLVSV